MLTIEFLEQIILDQKAAFEDKGTDVERDIDFKKYLSVPQIVVVSGVRRCGKSTLLKQFSRRAAPYYYLNFEDDRLLSFTASDFQNLLLAFKKQRAAKFVYLDEVQNVIGWESFARRLFEAGHKVFITGSSAKLLSGELASRLTGRYLKIELFPFSFKEFLRWQSVSTTDKSSTGEARLLKQFDEYARLGGFPEMLKLRLPEIAVRIYEDVVYRDLIVRYKIRETRAFRQLAGWLFANIAKETNYNALAKALQVKSVASIKNHVAFMAESYLLFEMVKYDWSLKRQYISGRKFYAIDAGLRGEVAFVVSEDRGRILENIVYLELRRRGKAPYYAKDKAECDFVTVEKNKITAAIQVADLFDDGNRERELAGLIEALSLGKLKQGLILTRSQSDNLIIKGFKIKVTPLWQWLIEE
ncbi:MAG: ATP-binding protein [Candidatus Magasanikbacteria bacterium]|nr:ATP-binding protein [Candidatus Magasanikbacteria bacterium]